MYPVLATSPPVFAFSHRLGRTIFATPTSSIIIHSSLSSLSTINPHKKPINRHDGEKKLSDRLRAPFPSDAISFTPTWTAGSLPTNFYLIRLLGREETKFLRRTTKVFCRITPPLTLLWMGQWPLSCISGEATPPVFVWEQVLVHTIHTRTWLLFFREARGNRRHLAVGVRIHAPHDRPPEACHGIRPYAPWVQLAGMALGHAGIIGVGSDTNLAWDGERHLHACSWTRQLMLSTESPRMFSHLPRG